MEQKQNKEQSFEKIGDIIRAERKAKGITIEYISERTKISKKFITAIEDSNYSIFPADIYLYGFVTNICEEISLDPKVILHKFEEERATTHYRTKHSPTYLNEEGDELIESNTGELQETPNALKSEYNIWMIATIAVGIFFIIFVFFILNNNGNTPAPIKTQGQESDIIPLEMKTEKQAFDEIKENAIIKIYSIGETTYTFHLEKVAGTSCTITIDGDDETKITLTAGQKVEIDLNKDGKNDLRIKLKSISGDMAFFYFEKIIASNTKINYTKIWENEAHITVNEQNYQLFSQIQESGKFPISVYMQAIKLDSYLSYTIDGKEQNKRNLKPGEDITITSIEQLQIEIGNYRSIILIINNKPISLISERTDFAITKIIKWDKDPDNETKYNLIIKDAN